MSSMSYTCISKRLHRTQAETRDCPGCLETLPAPTRQRRNATIASVQPDEEPDEEPDPVPGSPFASWETISNTPSPNRTPSPGAVSKAAGGPYPTPSCSQNEAPKYRHVRRGAISENPAPAIFTAARGKFPGPSAAPANGDGKAVQYSYDLLGNLQTTSISRRGPQAYNTPLPPPWPTSPPMAPRKQRLILGVDPLPGFDGSRTRSSPSALVEADAALAVPSVEAPDSLPTPAMAKGQRRYNMRGRTGSAAPPPTIQVPEPRASDNNDDDDDEAHNTNHAAQKIILHTLRESQATLTARLTSSAALVNHLRTSLNIAQTERDGALTNLHTAQNELENVRENPGDDKRRRLKGKICLKAIVALTVLGAIWRFVLHAPEYEYISERVDEGVWGLEL